VEVAQAGMIATVRPAASLVASLVVEINTDLVASLVAEINTDLVDRAVEISPTAALGVARVVTAMALVARAVARAAARVGAMAPLVRAEIPMAALAVARLGAEVTSTAALAAVLVGTTPTDLVTRPEAALGVVAPNWAALWRKLEAYLRATRCNRKARTCKAALVVALTALVVETLMAQVAKVVETLMALVVKVVVRATTKRLLSAYLLY